MRAEWLQSSQTRLNCSMVAVLIICPPALGSATCPSPCHTLVEESWEATQFTSGFSCVVSRRARSCVEGSPSPWIVCRGQAV